MITTMSILSAFVLATMASAIIKLFVSGVCPGLQSLSRWVMVGSLTAGWVLGALAALVGALISLGGANVIALAGGVAVVSQLGGWLLFFRWMFQGMSIKVTLNNMQPVLQSALQGS